MNTIGSIPFQGCKPVFAPKNTAIMPGSAKKYCESSAKLGGSTPRWVMVSKKKLKLIFFPCMVA
jgi:hypothetical protein